jgi:Amylo-alpha-1,6-glucosidase
MRTRLALPSIAAFGMRLAAISTTLSMARTRRRRFPSEPDLCDCTRASGSRPGILGDSRYRGAGKAVDAGWAAPRGAGRARLQVALFRRRACPRCRLSPGHGVGLAYRPVHRCLAQGSARHFLDGFEPHLAEAGIGSISEVFDAEPPCTPRGCIAQAWSVAEVLRCFTKTALNQEMIFAGSGASSNLSEVEVGSNRARPPGGCNAA